MATQSPSLQSRHKSRIIREMSRDTNKTFNSAASSTGSFHGTVSPDSTMNFDPENEAIMSTRQIDNLSQKLPELRDTAKKYGRWVPRPSQDVVINTSAIGRAFPDFSQGESSDDNMSIEVGRGAKSRQRTPSRAPRLEYSDNMDSPVVTIGDFQILKTPPGRTRTKGSISRDPIRNSAKKQDGQDRLSKDQKNDIGLRTQPAAKNDYISGATRNASGEERRSLDELHAHVSDDSDNSFSGEDRPANANPTTKASRFSNGQSAAAQGSATPASLKQRATDALANALRSVSQTTSNMHTVHTAKSSTPNPTQHSFLLPNMPDISELVSGTFKDGTPVFTRNGKVQSRFSSVSGPPNHINFAPIDGIPVPEDEKAIFLSLQLLQDRIAELEMERAENQKMVEDLQNENYQLKAENKELERNRRSDSALGMADSGSDGGSGSRKNLLADKTRLEAQVASLTVRLEAAERRVTTQEIRLKSNTAERDRAVQQLAEAYCTTEELRVENDTLKHDNEALRQQISQFLVENAEHTREWQKKEASLRRKIQRREKAVKEVKDITRELFETKHNITVTTTTQEKKKGTHKVNKEQPVIYQSKDVVKEMTTSIENPASNRPSRSRQSSIRKRSRSRSQRRLSTADAKSRAEQLAPEPDTLDESSEESDDSSLDETTTNQRKDQQNTTGNRDLTDDGSEYLSILDGGEIAHLREMLNSAKAEQRQRLAAAESEAKDDTIFSKKSTRSTSGRQQGALTGILKNGGAQIQDDLTGRLSIKNAKFSNENDHQRRPSTSHQVRQVSTRRRHSEVDMTSAFIIPDISFNAEDNVSALPVLSESAKRVLDGLCRHNSQNCMICTRIASHNADGNTITKRAVQVEKPVPVSERMPIPGPYEDEPTIRPAVAPGLALATVIKGLEDEVAHLKLKHAQLFSLYNKHDVSLGMRKRKSLRRKLTDLLKAIDTKSDQIYALYDVLEGQKQSGQEMTEQEVEVTLMSIGVEFEVLTRGSQKNDVPNIDREEDDSSDEDSELDLPWEGIEDTTGTVEGRRA
ncbi:hypothetical protein F5884DRAFT_748025 [Xylogone sp. PMI_703]|nr:hypothetical protein F5884DRAFT_748025 [Xylogone sp. PMI_703]